MKFDLSKIKRSKNDIKRGIEFPKSLNKELAELMGIIIGDGHLGFYSGTNKNGSKSIKSDIRISGNKNEKQYLEYIMHLFYSLFNLKLKYVQDTAPGAIILRAYSKGLVQFLNKTCGIPLNRKTDFVNIPETIKKSNNIIKYAFLKGLADTDFTVTFKNRTNKGHNYPVIKASFKSKNLIKDLEEIYNELGFKYSVHYNEVKQDNRFGPTTIHNIYLYGKQNFRKWIKDINFSNNKFRQKVEKWLKDGVCPPGY